MSHFMQIRHIRDVQFFLIWIFDVLLENSSKAKQANKKHLSILDSSKQEMCRDKSESDTLSNGLYQAQYGQQPFPHNLFPYKLGHKVNSYIQHAFSPVSCPSTAHFHASSSG